MSKYVIGSIVGILIALLLLEQRSTYPIRIEEVRDTVVLRDTVVRYLPRERKKVAKRDTVTVVFESRDTVTITTVDTFLVIDFFPRPDTIFRDTININTVTIVERQESFWEKVLYIAAGIGTGVVLMLVVR